MASSYAYIRDRVHSNADAQYIHITHTNNDHDLVAVTNRRHSFAAHICDSKSFTHVCGHAQSHTFSNYTFTRISNRSANLRCARLRPGRWMGCTQRTHGRHSANIMLFDSQIGGIKSARTRRRALRLSVSPHTHTHTHLLRPCAPCDYYVIRISNMHLLKD